MKGIQVWFSLSFLLYTRPEMVGTTWTSAGIEPRCEDFPYHPVCPLVLQPLCGTNGVTFTSLCNLCLYNWGTGFKIKILHEGVCDLVTGPTELRIKKTKI
ncbi:trypsin inhibitor ClTI-1-like [Pristis pectinata]|uniref:trypsin inhibitor ClTI-1-like n=1 Tax=Pristis pectinata TaxID=685728 RepID=UPI00223DA35F|nr:trypsin inhibitor ClTI-1-like [Pristis pectinata]